MAFAATAGRKTPATTSGRATEPSEPPQPKRPDGGSLTSLWRDVDWTVSFAGFLFFIFIILSHRLNLGAPAIGIAAGALFLERQKIRVPGFLVALGLYLAWGAFGLMYSSHGGVVTDHLIEYAKLWVIAFVAVNVLTSTARLRLFLVFFLACFLVFPARGVIFNFFFYDYALGGRAVWLGSFANPNNVAALIFLPLCIAVGLLAAERNDWIRLGAKAALFILPAVLLMTASRGGILALGLFAAIPVLKGRKKLRTLLLVLLLGIGASVVAPSATWDRMTNLFEAAEAGQIQEADSSAEQRWIIWQVSFDIIGDHPITGVGLGAYRHVHAQYAASNPEYAFAQGEKDVHNTFLDVLADTGIMGFALFLSMLVVVYRKVRELRRRLRGRLREHGPVVWFLGLGLLAYLAAGVFGTYSHLTYLYLHIAALSAAADLLRRKIQVSQQASNPARASRRRVAGAAAP